MSCRVVHQGMHFKYSNSTEINNSTEIDNAIEVDNSTENLVYMGAFQIVAVWFVPAELAHSTI